MRTCSIVLISTMALAACGSKDGGGGGAGGGGGKADPAAANAAVPADWKSKLEFEAASDDRHEVTYVRPKGWKEGFIPGKTAPPDDAAFGFGTSYSVGTNCDGMCEPKDWAPIVDKVETTWPDGSTVERDDKTDTSRSIVVALPDRKIIVMAWWKKGGSRYVACRATLATEAVALAPAFEAACRATVSKQ